MGVKVFHMMDNKGKEMAALEGRAEVKGGEEEVAYSK